jgi:hypothetical protein
VGEFSNAPAAFGTGLGKDCQREASVFAVGKQRVEDFVHVRPEFDFCSHYTRIGANQSDYHEERGSGDNMEDHEGQSNFGAYEERRFLFQSGIDQEGAERGVYHLGRWISEAEWDSHVRFEKV